jgi:transcriptional regulator with XRE-family HTH domain
MLTKTGISAFARWEAGLEGNEDWRDRLSAEIHTRGVKLTHLSASLGFHRDYVSNVISGKAKPSAEKLKAICDGIGVSFSYVLTGTRQLSDQDSVIRDLANLPEDSLNALLDLVKTGAYDRI